MKRNVGSIDRFARALGGLAMLTCCATAPLPLAVRLAAFGAMGGYLLLTAIAGSCLGYSLLGRSSCASQVRR